ncbi:MAG: class I SAM-dependent methyltransferase [Candidatus Odinarchaeota archaeon]
MKVAKTEDDFHVISEQTIKITAIPDGSVLDVGGGGEGIIAQIGGKRITAVDRLQSEIDEAKPRAPDANWVCADATKLVFPDESFDNATSFFSGMYMTKETLTGVFREVYRLIPENGAFWIWDAIIDYESGPFVIYLRIETPSGRVITTGYGIGRVERNRTATDIQQLLQECGFSIEEVRAHQYWYFIVAKKKG